jgi:uncharacterized protein
VILAVILGLLIGVTLGALGGGGSILAVPVLAHLAGQSAAAATATSLVAVGAASALASVSHARAGHVRWGAATAFVATGVAGSWVGAELNGRLDGDVLLLAFSGLVLVAAYRMLSSGATRTDAGAQQAMTGNGPEPLDAARRTGAGADAPTMTATADPPPATAHRERGAVIRVVIAGSVVGFLTGLFGVGGGFVIVPALTLALGFPLPAAIGTSLVVIAGNAVVALGFRGLDAVEWDIAVPFTATMLAGGLVGAAIAHRLPMKRSLQAFAGLLVAVAIGNGIAAAAALVS